MILNLAEAQADRVVDTGVCIIGAGIAGLILASRLRASGVPVTVLESGAAESGGIDDPLNGVVSLGRPYLGATKGRARGLGGTSTLWGGALIPFLPSDLEARRHVGVKPWPVQFDDVAPYVSEAEAIFGVGHDPYDELFAAAHNIAKQAPMGDPDFIARFAKWPAFKMRNVATLLKTQLEDDRDLNVHLNATAIAFHCEPEGRLDSVRAVAPNGRSIEVKAGRFVFCAGAVESTRLLLLLDSQNGGRVKDSSNALGRYFHDHVSLPAAELKTDDPAQLNRMAAFFFAGAAMRSLRFELSPQAQEAEACASGFAHIAFQTDRPSGFDVLRNVLKGVQQQSGGRFLNAAALVRHVPYLARAGYWRVTHKQLLWPAPARYQLHIVAEQLPRSDSQIALAGETDRYGCQIATIDWRVGKGEADTISAFARRYDAYWKRHGLDRMAILRWNLPLHGDVEIPEDSFSDIYHPGGTTRMGDHARESVVDKHLDCFAVPNLSIAATSVFPSGASANPTMMLIAFALRLGDRLGRLWASENASLRIGPRALKPTR